MWYTKERNGLCLILIFMFVILAEGQTWSDTANLMDFLFSYYDTDIRPVQNQSLPVVVDVIFEILTIQDVDELSGKIAIVGLVVLKWRDQILTWNPSDHGHIQSLVLPHNRVWYPQLELTNPYSKPETLGYHWLTTRVSHNGEAESLPTGVFESTCNIDVTSYPFDTQVCSMIFVASGYRSNEVTLTSPGYVATSHFSENGEWSLDKTSAFRVPANTGDQLVFRFHLQRKSKFVFVNLVLPIIFMGLINLLVFILPSDSGERVGFAVTVLLAFAVFLTIVADNLPNISEPMPVMSNFLTAALALSLSMCVMTIVSLFFYHKDKDNAPSNFVQKIVSVLLCRQFKMKCASENGTTIKRFAYNDEGRLNKETWSEDPVTSNNEVIPKVTWQDVSRCLDALCLIVFLVGQIAVNTYYIAMLKQGSAEKDESSW